MKFLVVGGSYAIEQMLHKHKHDFVRHYDEDVDAAIFTGGEDLTPFLYGEKPLSLTSNNFVRDLKEVGLYYKLPVDLPKIGICRGAQLLNVLSGGRLWQHVDNHDQWHDMLDEDTGEVVRVSSTHHQMMRPSANAHILGTAAEATYKESETELWKLPNKNENKSDDIEAVFYEHSNSFCFQPHPEYGPDDCTKWFFDKVDQLFFNKNKELAHIEL